MPAIDLDAVLAELGQFGRFQVRNYCFILLPIVFSAVYISQYIFAAGDVNYRCEVPECESSPPLYWGGDWVQWALPPGAGGRCSRRPPLEPPGCDIAAFNATTTQECNSWVYEDHNTIVAEFGLACQDWRRTLVGTVHSAGMLIALPIVGYLSDTFGRRTVFVTSAFAVALMGLVRSLVSGYIIYLVFEFLDAAIGTGVYSTGFILALEMVGLKWRVLGGNLISCSFALGQVLVALVAWAVPYWRNLTRAIYAPSLIFIGYFFILDESVRWLLSKGRKEEAVAIIHRAAAINGKKLSPKTIKQLEDDNLQITTNEDVESHEKKRSLVMEILQSRVIMCRLLICSFWWISLTFIYYGLSINSVTLAGNKYVNFILTSLVEIPGYSMSILALDRFGRKRSIMSAFLICGVSLILLPFVPDAYSWLATLLNLLGKMCISMAFSSIYIYTSELFPTSARHRLLSVCSMLGRIGNLVAPQTPLLAAYMVSLPYLLFGSMALGSGLLLMLTPETLNSRLPDTVHQAETLDTKPSDPA